MKTVSLSGSLRENVGKKDTKALRNAEMVPCVMYGAGEEQIHFATAEKNFTKILFTPETYIIEFDVNGKTYKTILQDIQYHPVTDKVLHARKTSRSPSPCLSPSKARLPVSCVVANPRWASRR